MSQEPKTELLNPNVDLDIEVPNLGGVRHKLDMDSAEVDTALREVGMSKVNVKRWKACATVGKILETLGAIQVCVGEYVVNDRIRDEMIQKCRRLHAETDDIEQIVALTNCMNAVLKDSDHNVRHRMEAIKAELIKTVDSDQQGRLPPKGTPIVAVQINQGVAKEQTKE